MVGTACLVTGIVLLKMNSVRDRAIEERLADFGVAARDRLAPDFLAAGVAYPPAVVVLVADKSARTMTLHAGATRDGLKQITSWPVLGMSGGPGPKLREGDLQVPEGIYQVELLNPQSIYHVSLRLNYPNAFDRARAKDDGRDRPGSDIYIHGGKASVGCLAMGDSVAEDLFTLAADTGLGAMEVIITPGELKVPADGPPWLGALYADIAKALAGL